RQMLLVLRRAAEPTVIRYVNKEINRRLAAARANVLPGQHRIGIFVADDDAEVKSPERQPSPLLAGLHAVIIVVRGKRLQPGQSSSERHIVTERYAVDLVVARRSPTSLPNQKSRIIDSAWGVVAKDLGLSAQQKVCLPAVSKFDR